MEIAEVLDKMSLSDIVKGMILLKPGKQIFFYDELRQALSSIAVDYPRVNDLYRSHDRLLQNIICWESDVLEWDFTIPQYRLSDHGKKRFEGILKEEYGKNILHELKPVINEAWNSLQKWS